MLRIPTFVALTMAAAQPALAAPLEYGQDGGQRFAYTSALRANGFIHIAGEMLGTHEPFVLNVAPDGHVGGNFGDVAVDYRVSKRVRDAAAAQLGEGRAVADATPRK